MKQDGLKVEGLGQMIILCTTREGAIMNVELGFY